MDIARIDVFVEMFSEGVFIVENNEIIQCNKIACKILDCERKDLINLNIQSLFCFSENEIYNIFTSTYNEDKIFHNVILQNNSDKLISCDLKIMSLDNLTTRILIVFNEIYTFKNRSEFYSYNILSFKNSKLPKIIIDNAGTILNYNISFENIFKEKSQDFNLFNYINLDEYFSSNKKDTINHQLTLQLDEKNKKSYFNMYATKIALDNKKTGYLVEFFDVRTYDLINFDEMKTKRILDIISSNIPQGILVEEISTGNIIFCNVQGHSINNRLARNNEYKIEREKLLKEKVSVNNHVFKENEDYYSIYYLENAIIHNDRKISIRVNIYEDITKDIVHKEFDMQRSKMSALGQLASGITHDFNNHLSNIMGYAKLIEESNNIDLIKNYTNKIQHSCKNASSLIKQILMFSKKNFNSFNEVNILEILNNIVSIMESTFNKNIKIQTSFRAQDSIIYGDEVTIESAILNLVINAKDAMPQGGGIIIETKNEFISSSKIISYGQELKLDNYIVVTITDTGMGINEEIIGKIFEPYFSTKGESGTGLGLPVVFGCMKTHDGCIEVNSDIDKGTSFSLYFPLKKYT
ncbi:MAG: two-component system sensor histidine kinase NtrB [Eubacteriaceae bacterium]